MPDPPSLSTEHSREVRGVLSQLKQFFSTVLRWVIMTRSGRIGPGQTPVNPTDTGTHSVAPDADFLVSNLNFRNRVGNTGNLTVGNAGDQFIVLLPGQSVSPSWTYPAEWYYKVVGGVAADVYEIWWN